jgi:tellurite resistance protein TerC
VGATLIEHFHWILAVFGLFLLYSGWRMFFSNHEEVEIAENRLLQWMRNHLRVTPGLHGMKFFVRAPAPKSPNALWVTPLFVALVMVEIADVVFAVDSVPAVFAVTQDPYIVYTSNIFAILGLRTLYFTLAALVNRFAYLSKALACTLVFIGGKILYAEATGDDLPIVYSLGVVLALILGGIGVSLAVSQKKA